MRYHADLHVHSRYSRATSSDCDLFHLAWWARRKGITVVGTGDFTHPAWMAELKRQLVPAEPGLFRLQSDVEQAVSARLEGPCRGTVRFMLSVEISTIYKKGERVRKVHHLVYVPDFEAAERFVAALARVGNLNADGRPILGLDSRHLLEMVLASSPGSYLVPAHIWTPWFSVLGSKAGFDAVEECYGDLAPHVFALETGLSSDPAMNWRLSRLDRYRLVSSSDAHSPPKLGRETTVFDGPIDYFSLRRALETGEGFVGTMEFFPEEGKYHLDGHRACGVRLEPSETLARGEMCPTCGRPVTVGVLHRVETLADRDEGYRPEHPPDFRSVVPLPEVLAELSSVGPSSQVVEQSYRGLLSRLGPELFILQEAPLEDITRAGSSLLSEGIARMREGRVIREAGYDGLYGTIRLFSPDEIKRRPVVALLFEDEPSPTPAPKKQARSADKPGRKTKATEGEPEVTLFASRVESKATPETPPSLLDGLDPDQRAAAEVVRGPLLVVAGPGTGKTRTLTHRIAHLVQDQGVPPERILAITFTRRAADEMRERLVVLLGDAGARVPAMTFHALGLLILRDHGDRAEIGIAGERERVGLVAEALSVTERKATQLCAAISRWKRRVARRAEALQRFPEEYAPGTDLDRAFAAYEEGLAARNLVDFDDLVTLAVELLESRPDVLAALRERFVHVSVDEFQDVDERQYRLLLLLAGEAQNVCAIGDPDQAIYGFRGSDVSFFFRFREDYPAASVVRLGKNYRSTRTIVDAALGVIAPSPTVGERVLRPLIEDRSRIVIHEARTERAEAEWVVHVIERLVGGTSLFSMDSGRVESAEGEGSHAFGDMAILYRTDAQAQALVEALRRSGMPFQRRTHDRVLERAAAMAIVRSFVATHAKGAPLAPSLEAAAARVREEIAAPLGPEDAASSTPQEGAEAPSFREADVDAALVVLLVIAARSGEDAERFRLEVSLEVEVDTWDPRADRISLLTLHASKGLEFRVVLVVGCEDGLLPLRFKGREDEADVAEERRLFYVGMTRARERLFLSYARERVRHGKPVAMEASPFLREIEERLLTEERADLPKKGPDPRKKQLTLF
ncbi:UvrD-helicase domain-containing protein [Polyangium sp. 15x6]|uniref:UvrD-helicase domain-containing protein n=1 Tax=Polyangium sp. 15x6 TaxID=3042687 RepID=UPI00249B2566|nr:UvrD-helicase domain-containing protein [Polyangium sp. 15x6]MDI3284107.1 UvrD-helicase domain-containing protein [Polyangium sp. 15x6]